MNFLVFVFELRDRVKTKSPAFFVKLQWAAGILIAISLLLMKLISAGIWSPSHASGISEMLGWLAAGMIGVFCTSTTTKQDPLIISDSARLADGPGGTDPNKTHGTPP